MLKYNNNFSDYLILLFEMKVADDMYEQLVEEQSTNPKPNRAKPKATLPAIPPKSSSALGTTAKPSLTSGKHAKHMPSVQAPRDRGSSAPNTELD